MSHEETDSVRPPEAVSQLRAEPYAEALAAEWDAFVRRSRNGTLLHERGFLGYHPPGRFVDASLLIRDGARLVSVFPAALLEEEEVGGAMLSSHPGSSYGGPVFSERARTPDVARTLDSIEAHASARGARAVQMRLPPSIFHRPAPLDELEFLLKLRGYRIQRAELSTYLDLSAAPSEALDLLPGKCRTDVRRGLKSGLEPRESDDLEQFYALLTDNLTRRHQAKPTHDLTELTQLRQRFPEQIRLFTAHDGDRMVAGTLLFVIAPGHAAHTFYMASAPESRERRPLHVAIWAAISWALEAELRVLNFGVSTPQGRFVDWGLLRFKESWGGRGVERLTYRRVLP